MTQTEFNATLAAIADEGLWRTNPVWCVDRLLREWGRSDSHWSMLPDRLLTLITSLGEHGVRLPGNAVERWVAAERLSPGMLSYLSSEGPTSRVLGLVVEPNSQNAFVLP